MEDYVSAMVLLEVSRPHTLKHTRTIRYYYYTLPVIVFSSSDLLFRVPLPVFWEYLVPYGQYLTFYVVGVTLLIGVPWSIVLRMKLRR